MISTSHNNLLIDLNIWISGYFSLHVLNEGITAVIEESSNLNQTKNKQRTTIVQGTVVNTHLSKKYG